MKNKNSQKYIDVAANIGAKLAQDALWDGNRCNWIGQVSDNTNQKRTIFRSLGPDFYEGTSGIAFFFAHLYKVTQDPIFKIVTEGALNQIISCKDKLKTKGEEGFYSGLSGAAFCLVSAGEILHNEFYVTSGLAILKELKLVEQKNLNIDIINGPAGAIPTLLFAYNKYKEDVFLDIALSFGNYLLRCADKEEIGWSWNTISHKIRNLTGFAHGTAGIATSLFELYYISNDHNYLFAAEQAFRYENYWYDEHDKNWPDFRDLDGSKRKTGVVKGMMAWCHGAPGIGLSRIRAFEITKKHEYKTDALKAIDATTHLLEENIRNNISNLSLCHGILGNADLLIRSYNSLNEDRFLNMAERVGYYGIENYAKNSLPWPSGLLNMKETIGFMLGNSGMGYYYLRLSNPEIIPCALMITP